MYSCVPDSAEVRLRYRRLWRIRSACSLRLRVPGDELVEGALGVEHDRGQLAAPVPIDTSRRVAEVLQAERVGQPPRRIDGHDTGLATLFGAGEADRGRDGRLARPARPTAHDDGLAGDQGREVSSCPVRYASMLTSYARRTRSWRRRRCSVLRSRCREPRRASLAVRGRGRR